MTQYRDRDPRLLEPPDDPHRVWERLRVAFKRPVDSDRTIGEHLFDARYAMQVYRAKTTTTCTGWHHPGLKFVRRCERPLCPMCWHTRQRRAGAAILASTGPYWQVIATNDVPASEPLAPAVLTRFHGNRATYRIVTWVVAPFVDYSRDGYGDVGAVAWRKIGVFCTDRPVRPRSGLVDGGWLSREEFGDVESTFNRWVELNPHPWPAIEHYDFGAAEFGLDQWNDRFGYTAGGQDEPTEPSVGSDEPHQSTDTESG